MTPSSPPGRRTQTLLRIVTAYLLEIRPSSGSNSASAHPGAQWLEALCRHIPDRYEHLVRYVGWYSNRARGDRAKKASPHADAVLPAPSEEPSTEFAARAKAAWRGSSARSTRPIRWSAPSATGRCASFL